MGADEQVADEKVMNLRYAGACRVCGVELPARTRAVYERSTKTVRCVTCPAVGVDEAVTPEEPIPSVPPTPPTVEEESSDDGPPMVEEESDDGPLVAGTPGASARREYERRSEKDEARIRKRWGRLGGLAVALADERQTTRSWAVGARGERLLGEKLGTLASPKLAIIHDTKVPGTRANIDHVAVTPGGVWAIDPKRYKGRIEKRVEGGLIRERKEMLFVGNRNRTKLVEGLHMQQRRLQEIVPGVPVRMAIVFVDGDWPLIRPDFVVDDVKVVRPKKLYKLLDEDEGDHDVEAVFRQLLTVLEPA